MIWIIAASLLCLGVCLPMFMYCKYGARYQLAAMYKAAGTLCALIPALVAVYAGCILFVLILALLGCRILSKTDRS